MNNRMKDIGIWIVAALPLVLLMASMPVAWAYWVDRIWGFFIVGFFSLSILGWLIASLFRFLKKIWRKIRPVPTPLPPSPSPVSSTTSDEPSAEIDALLLYNYRLHDEPQNLAHSHEPDLAALSSAEIRIKPKPSDGIPLWLAYALWYFIAAAIYFWAIAPDPWHYTWIEMTAPKFIELFIMQLPVAALFVGMAIMLFLWVIRHIGGFLFNRAK